MSARAPATLDIGTQGELAVESDDHIAGTDVDALLENRGAHKELARAFVEALQRQFLLCFPALHLGVAENALTAQLGHLLQEQATDNICIGNGLHEDEATQA